MKKKFSSEHSPAMGQEQLVISAVSYGSSSLPASMVFAGETRGQNLPYRIPPVSGGVEKRTVLIDAGCDTMPGFVMKDFISPAAALKLLGTEPKEITDLVITHAHHDHIDGARHFPNAEVYLQAEEYQAGKSYLPNPGKAHVFQTSCLVAGSIRVQRVGGHSTGSSIATIETADKTYVFGGDECYLRQCLEQKIPTGCSCNPDRSKQFIAQYSKPGYQVLLAHEPTQQTGKIAVIKEEDLI